MNPNRITLFTAALAAAYSHRFTPGRPKFTVHADGKTSAGAGASDVKVWGSNKQNPSAADDTEWVLLGTISLLLAVTQGGGALAVDAPWNHVRAEVDSISGTDAQVDVYANVG